MLCFCDVALMLDIDKGKSFFCSKMVPIYTSVQRAGSTTWARASDWPVVLEKRSDGLSLQLVIAESAELGARLNSSCPARLQRR